MKKLLGIFMSMLLMLSLVACVAQEIPVADALAELESATLDTSDWAGLEMKMETSYGDNKFVISAKIKSNDGNPEMFYSVDMQSDGSNLATTLYLQDDYMYVSAMGSKTKVPSTFKAGDSLMDLLNMNDELPLQTDELDNKMIEKITKSTWGKTSKYTIFYNQNYFEELLAESFDALDEFDFDNIAEDDIDGSVKAIITTQQDKIISMSLKGDFSITVGDKTTKFIMDFDLKQFKGNIDFPDLEDYKTLG